MTKLALNDAAEDIFITDRLHDDKIRHIHKILDNVFIRREVSKIWVLGRLGMKEEVEQRGNRCDQQVQANADAD